MKDKINSSSIDGSSSGFTLIELLVVIAVAAILLSIAVPSYSDFVKQQRIGSAANAFKNAVALARSEARKRGENVAVRPIGWSSGSSLSLAEGWYVFYKTNPTTEITLLTHQLDSGNFNVTGSGSGGFYFTKKTGRLGSGPEKKICFSDSNNSSNVKKHTATINISGSAVITVSDSC